jgi:hypothetical protein
VSRVFDPANTGLGFPIADTCTIWLSGRPVELIDLGLLVQARSQAGGFRMAGLKQQEIKWLIHEYIGVKMGDLQDFSFNSLKDFYGLYCDLDINTDDYEGTKRQRFESILQ